MYFLYFTDSIGQRHQLFYQAHSYPNLMEFISDQAYEDWGDCRGRAWCASCHIAIRNNAGLAPSDRGEKARLSQLSNIMADSRLVCQIPLNKDIHEFEISFIGAD